MSQAPMHPPAGNGGLVEFSTRRRVTIAMITLTFVLFGVIALRDLKVNLLPDLSYPTLTVRTEYTGAAPAEIETLLAKPVEEAVGVVKNLRKLRSVSRTGQSDVILEFAWGTDMDQASLEVRDKLEVLRLPLESETPVLLRFNPGTEPIMRLALSAKAGGDPILALKTLRRYADEDLKKKLEPVDGVAAVKVSGGLEDEIQVDIDQQRLSQLGLSIGSVIDRLKQENVNVSGGRLEEGTQRYLVRTVNQFANVGEIRNLFIANAGTIAAGVAGNAAATSADPDAGSRANAVANAGTPIYLRDIAEVRQGYKEREAIIRLGSQEAVELAIYKEGDANTVSAADAVKVSGGLEDEIQVDIDQQRLSQLGLSIGSVIDRLKQENVNVSGGRLEEGTQRYLVRTVNQFANVGEIRNLFIANAGTTAAGVAGNAAATSADTDAGSRANAVANAGTPIYLRDIAEVRQGYKEREAIIRLGSQEAIELAIYKEGDANTVSAADAVKEKLEELKKQIPPDAELTTIDDQSVFIRSSIREVQKAAIEGGLLAILIIFLFLRDGWSTFVISLSLPVSIIATFFFMGQLGLSLNVMSLGGLALATGLVVDDSIVVLESIAKARERGLGILEAAVVGTREVSMAVVASTLTTIAVFLPLVFVEGIAGQLFRDQALTVAIAIAISLAVAMTLIPMLSSLKGRAPMAFPEEAAHPQWQPDRRWQKPLAATGHGIGAGVRGLFFGIAWLFVRAWRGLTRVVGPVMRKASDVAMAPYGRAERSYMRVLPRTLDRPWPVLVAAAVAFALALAAIPLLGADLIPQLAQDRFEMTVKLPPGTPLRETDAVVRQLQGQHADDDGVRTLYGVSGSGTRLDANPTESGENIGKLTVVMADGGDADTEATLTEGLRESMQAHPGAEVDFSRPELFSFSTPLEIELRGQELAQIEQAGRKLAALLRKNDHYADVKSTVEEGFPEIQIRFDQQRAAALGLTTRQIADQVVRKVRGEVASRYSFRDRKIDILVRARESDRASVDDIRNLIVNPQSARPVTLDSVADVVATTGPSEIHRVDQVRVAIVSANLRDIDLGSAVQEVQQIVAENALGAGVGMHIGGQGEELAQSVRSLLFAFGLAIFLVYLVMASQFESLLHPFVILFTIPLALVGAVMALLLTRAPVSVVVFIGLILLVGIVVKNAIILIDKVNQLREAGMPKREALAEGARSRLRPIIMTTLCTLFGFLPLAIGAGEGAEVRAPMAVTVIGGLTVSTLLTLLVIPIVYNLLDRRADAYYLERGRRKRSRIVAEEVDDTQADGGAAQPGLEQA